MGHILVVGSGVDSRIVSRSVHELEVLGHSVEVVTDPAKVAEIHAASSKAPLSGHEQEKLAEFVALLESISSEQSCGYGIVQFPGEKVVDSVNPSRYGSPRSRAGRAARWR